jgi:hypothetical protein
LQYFGNGYYKIGKNDKPQQLSILNCSIIFKREENLSFNNTFII